MYVISLNPVIKPNHVKNINTHIANTGHQILVFRHKHHAEYAKKYYASNQYIVKTDLETLRAYGEYNKLFSGLKIITNFYCDLQSKKEIMECEEVRNASIF